MSRRRVLLLLAGGAAAVAGGVAAVVLLVLDSDLPRAPAVPPGPPVVAAASFSPRIHLFGDLVIGHVDVSADRRRVDTGTIRLVASVPPYVRAGVMNVERSVHGSVERRRYSLRLVCLRRACTLSTPSSPRENPPTQRTFTFPAATVSFRRKGAERQSVVAAPWPALVVATRIASARPSDFAFTSDLAVPRPSYAVDPDVLVPLLIVLGLALVLVPPAVLLRDVPRRLLRRRARPLSPRELALHLLDWSAARDVADCRRALERVAQELAREPEPRLAERSRVAAWSRPEPDAQVAAALREQLRDGASVNGGQP